MSYTDKSWQAAFRIAEQNLKKQGKQLKKDAKKIWGNDLMVGAIGYQFTQGFIQGYNDTMQALKAQAEAATEAMKAQADAQAAQQEESEKEVPEEAAPSEENDSEE